MSKYRTELPQLDGGIFLTDGDMETCLIYHNGIDLPKFSAVHLMTSPAGRYRFHFRDPDLAAPVRTGAARSASTKGRLAEANRVIP